MAMAPLGKGARDTYQRLIFAVYNRFNPAKLPDVGNFFEKYGGSEDELYYSIVEKYIFSEEHVMGCHWRPLIEGMCRRFNPENLSRLDGIFSKYEAQDDGPRNLYEALCDKYIKPLEEPLDPPLTVSFRSDEGATRGVSSSAIHMPQNALHTDVATAASPEDSESVATSSLWVTMPVVGTGPTGLCAAAAAAPAVPTGCASLSSEPKCSRAAPDKKDKVTYHRRSPSPLAYQPRSFSPFASDEVDVTWRWEFAFREAWRPFNAMDSEAVESAYTKWSEGCNPHDGGSTLPVTFGKTTYRIDFVRMVQVNLSSGTERQLRRIKISTPVGQEGRSQTYDASSSSVSACVLVSNKRKRTCNDAKWAELEKQAQKFQRLLAQIQLERDQEKARADSISVERDREKARNESLQIEKDQEKARADSLLVERDQEKSRSDSLQIERDQEKARAHKLSSSHAQFQEEVELWRQQTIRPAKLFPRSDMVHVSEDALKNFVSRSHSGRCATMRWVQVTQVQQVANIRLWKTYKFHRQQIADAVRHRQECSSIMDVNPRLRELSMSFPHIYLDRWANEVLLFHGTKQDKVEHIVQQGFDERLNDRGLYGKGVDFTFETCKAEQYCDQGPTGVMILSRVILGHPFMAKGEMTDHERPPLADGHGVPHDSVIAPPGIPNHKGKSKRKTLQAHWEFVIPRGDLQVYPEFVIAFSRT